MCASLETAQSIWMGSHPITVSKYPFVSLFRQLMFSCKKVMNFGRKHTRKCSDQKQNQKQQQEKTSVFNWLGATTKCENHLVGGWCSYNVHYKQGESQNSIPFQQGVAKKLKFCQFFRCLASIVSEQSLINSTSFKNMYDTF